MEGGRERQGQQITVIEGKDHTRLRNESGSMRKVRKMETWVKRGGRGHSPASFHTSGITSPFMLGN